MGWGQKHCDTCRRDTSTEPYMRCFKNKPTRHYEGCSICGAYRGSDRYDYLPAGTLTQEKAHDQV